MSQFDFVGGAYEAANPMQDDQALINWYVELDQSSSAKSPKALLGSPGKVMAVTSTFTGEVRGGHVMPGGQTAYLVIGNRLVKMTIVTQVSGSTFATFALSGVGTLSTSAGQVCMRDNGTAGILVVVDGASMYAYNTKTSTFSSVDDPNVIKPSRVISIDGTLYWNSVGTQRFNASPIYWNGTDAFDGTMFALKDDGPDNLVTMIENERQAWFIGEETSEVWYAGASGTFQLSRLQGAMKQIGCAAAQSIVRTGHGLCWLGRSERGENFVVLTSGYDFQTISSPALAYALTQYRVISDAFAYCYTEEGHEFYQLTFPTADATWVYDFSTKLWHQRAYLKGTALHRDRANCLINFAGQRLVGDYANGQVYRQGRDIFVDGDAPLKALRRAPYVWDENDRNRVRHNRLQVEFTPGVGTAVGQGQNPQIMVRWRDERGWSNEYEVPIGMMGDTRNRAILRRLGASRYRVYEVSITDPVPRDVVGASLRAMGSSA